MVPSPVLTDATHEIDREPIGNEGQMASEARRCPSCGADVEEGVVICAACDHILDPSFLEEADAGLEEEDTDPRMNLPSQAAKEETTDPGADDRLPDDDHPTVGGSLDEDDRPTMVGGMDEEEDEHPTLAGDPEDPPGHAPAAATSAPREAARPREPRRPAGAGSRPLPPPPAPKPRSGQPDRSDGGARKDKDVVTDTAPRKAPPRQRALASQSQRAPAPPESAGVDPSSELLDDYEKLLRNLWRRFLEVPIADKILACGIVLGLLAVLMPWRVYVSEEGLYQVRSGLFLGTGGWAHLLLACGIGTIFYLKNFRGAAGRMELVLAQVAMAAAGVGWGVVAFLVGLHVAATSPDFGSPSAGPAYGMTFSLVAWSIASAGAVLQLMDTLTTRKKPRQGHGQSP